jgi:cleavage stimulation factor subunit 2
MTPDLSQANLIMQVLQLTDEQISQLPGEQQSSIRVLRDQISKAQQGIR